MEKLITSWSNFQSVPEDYIFPPESRPGNIKIPFSSSIPVIDLSDLNKGDRTSTIHKIIKAAQEFGFFQVRSSAFFFSNNPFLKNKHYIFFFKLYTNQIYFIFGLKASRTL